MKVKLRNLITLSHFHIHANLVIAMFMERSTLSPAGQHEKVVVKADEVWRKLKKEYGAISSNEVWCVFDCDGNTDSLNRAIKAAESKGFNAIYSIQCFELWFLLHFQPLTTAIDRKDYDRRLSNHLGINYEHGMKGMYHLLQNRQEDAIRAASSCGSRKQSLVNSLVILLQMCSCLLRHYDAHRNLKNRR